MLRHVDRIVENRQFVAFLRVARLSQKHRGRPGDGLGRGVVEIKRQRDAWPEASDTNWLIDTPEVGLANVTPAVRPDSDRVSGAFQADADKFVIVTV